jgi:8-oxo-dGTP diphosphatase
MSPQPAPGALLSANPSAVSRQRERELSPDRFASIRKRIDNGLRWGVGAVVLDDADRVLLVHEAGRWCVPGGGAEPGESLTAALRREVREETGVEIRLGALEAVTEQAFVHDGDRVSFHFATYEGRARTTDLASEPGLHDEEIEAVEWRASLPENTLDSELVERVRR